MKRRNFIKNGLLFVPFVPNIIVRAASPIPFNPQIRTVVASSTCPDDNSPSQANDSPDPVTQVFFGGSDPSRSFGQTKWTDGGTPRTICKLAFKLTRNSGDISALTFNAEICTVSGDTFTAVVATSNNVPGDNGWSSTWVVFEFGTPYLTTASQTYALRVIPSAATADMIGYSDNTGLTGHRERWSTANAATFGSGNDAAIRIYWQ